MNNIICVYVTCKDADEARKIARHLVEARFVASANILPQIESMFYWGESAEKVEFNDIEESLLLMFCKEENFEIVKDKILELHSYILPCVIAMPISLGHEKFLDWVNKNSMCS